MDTSDIIASIALIFSVVSAVYAIIVHVNELNRRRKQSTLDAFNELAGYTQTAIRVIADDRRKKQNPSIIISKP